MVKALAGGVGIPTATRIIEIAGPAGAGKTTISTILGRHGRRIQLGRFPDVNQIADAPFFTYHSLSMIPLLMESCLRGGQVLKRRELAWLAILRGWSRRLQAEKRRSDKIIILDQGPVYLLAETNELGPACLRSPRARKFWQNIYERWSATLDMVIWLDADNAHLHERIRTRGSEHVVKDEPAPVVFEFLDSYRMAYQNIFSRLKADQGGPRIIRFDTGQIRPEEIAAKLYVEFGLQNEHS